MKLYFLLGLIFIALTALSFLTFTEKPVVKNEIEEPSAQQAIDIESTVPLKTEIEKTAQLDSADLLSKDNFNNFKTEEVINNEGISDDILAQEAIREELQIKTWSEEHIQALREKVSESEAEFFKNSDQTNSIDYTKEQKLREEADKIEQKLIENGLLEASNFETEQRLRDQSVEIEKNLILDQ